MSDPATTAPYGSPLTAAELRVVRAMRVATSEADAARRLNLSPHTVKAHLRNARSRLGVKTTRELVVRVAA
jgi:DNA-binding CsgD family transcriptional regulator